ncbi:STAS domain-containing protein [Plantactinospora sp. BC1]|uniref:STAS domain-containing protein n=1 Tax=Plantactinospora sp. BC1 TaxID=2108470 RepID=UPI00131F3D81|nr:STAS domain-containing protein [Plantactinospora sp. BC1]
MATERPFVDPAASSTTGQPPTGTPEAVPRLDPLSADPGTREEQTLDVAVDPRPDGDVTLRLDGYLDMDTVETLRRVFGQLLDRELASLTVDLSRLTFCDAAGIRALLECRAWTNALGGTLLVVSPSPFVRLIFEVTRVAELFGLPPATDT